jgi:ABC-type bacteriocin/lantibiotic exporter with double-glycine peptidase domain
MVPAHSFNEKRKYMLSSLAKEYAVVIENLEGISAIKAFSRERERYAIWHDRRSTAINATLEVANIQNIWDVSESTLKSIETIAFSCLGIAMVIDGLLSLGQFFALTAYRLQFSSSAYSLIKTLSLYKGLDAHLARLADIVLAEPEENQNNASAIDERNEADCLAATDVSYRYGIGEAVVKRPF